MSFPADTRRDERGATLVLALILLLVGSLLVLSLTGLATSSLLNSTNIRSQHRLEYAAEGAVTAAVQATRESLYSSSTCAPLSIAGAGAINDVPIYVKCSAAGIQSGQVGYGHYQIAVAFHAYGCPTCTTPIVTAVVLYGLNASFQVYAYTSVQSWVVNTADA
jgi:Tfp pilus assembly protein PilX